MTRADADVDEVASRVLTSGDVGRVVEPARCLSTLPAESPAAPSCAMTPPVTRLLGVLAVVDVEAPDLAAHVGRVHAVGVAVAVDVDDLDLGGIE